MAIPQASEENILPTQTYDKTPGGQLRVERWSTTETQESNCLF